MIVTLAAIQVFLNAVLGLLFGYMLAIVVAALVRRPVRAIPTATARARFLVVIPAHDEEENIRSTVASCRAVDYDPTLYSVVVIADNCSDATARVARDAGAEVFERTTPDRRSKGHALEDYFAVAPLGSYDAAVLIDADTVVDPTLLAAFAGALGEGKDWVQCYYTVRNPDASWRTRLMTYAFSLFNGVWLLGQDRLGLGVGLKGNGMCFSTRGLARSPWSAHGLTEDLEFSWTLRVAGERIHFLPTTRVFAAMLSRGGRAAATQRRRWEDGRKALRRAFLGPLLRSRSLGPLAKIMYALDLLYPPLVVLLGALVAAGALRVGMSFDPRLAEAGRWLLPAQAAMAAVLAAYSLSPFVVMGLPARYLSSLVLLPYYAAWKMLITITQKAPTAWVRTPREPSVRDAT